jgi:hypothetical protein
MWELLFTTASVTLWFVLVWDRLSTLGHGIKVVVVDMVLVGHGAWAHNALGCDCIRNTAQRTRLISFVGFLLITKHEYV